MECADRYEKVCSVRFDSLDRKVDRVLALMVGNGNQPGFGERLRLLEAAQRAVAEVRRDWKALAMVVAGRVLSAAVIAGAGMFVGWLLSK